jgi:salicylate hydroxylase
LTGEIVKANGPSLIPVTYRPQRVRRTRLQSALKAKVPEGIVKLRKRLVSLGNLTVGGVKITFDDGSETMADLVVGRDGIRIGLLYLSPHKNTG